MCEETLFGQLFILGTHATIVGVGIDADAATGGEDPSHLDVPGIHQLDQIFHDDVHAVFMKSPMVAEAEEV